MPLYRDLAATFVTREQLGYLTTGEETFPRRLAQAGAVSSPTGRLRIVPFTARKSETINSLRMASANTAAGAAPTLCRFGIYTLNAAGDGTALVAAIANDVTLFAAAQTEYTSPLIAPWAKVAGQRYAAASLVVTAVAAPTLVGISAQSGGATSWTRSPTEGFYLDGQADLPAGWLIGALTGSASIPYLEMVP